MRLLSVDDTRRVHREALQWLEAQLEDEETRTAARVVVLTHHTPSMRGTSDPKHGFFLFVFPLHPCR